MNSSLSYGQSVVAGLTGSLALTGIHEALRRTVAGSPRMDLLGMQSLSRLLQVAGVKVPGKPALFGWTLLGDIGGNALYYSLAARGGRKSVWIKAISLGLAAGISAVLLPKRLGLNERASNRKGYTALATVAIYVVGGIVTAAVTSAISPAPKKRPLKIEASKVHSG